MKMTIEVDCSPEEARRFLGLPDVSSLNDHLVGEMKKRIDANMSMISPDEMVKKTTRPAIFKWRQTGPELILCAVRW